MESWSLSLVETWSTLGSRVYRGQAPVTLVLPCAASPNTATPRPSVTALAFIALRTCSIIAIRSHLLKSTLEDRADDKLATFISAVRLVRGTCLFLWLSPALLGSSRWNLTKSFSIYTQGKSVQNFSFLIPWVWGGRRQNSRQSRDVSSRTYLFIHYGRLS